MTDLIHQRQQSAKERLKQATKDFQAVLSADENASFLDNLAKGRATKPTPHDVLQFGAVLDEKTAGQGKGGRCFSVRLMRFLDGLQIYVRLGDIAVGGSQNLIACSVWSLVRFSVLMFANYAKHLEKISSLFLEIGRTAPRHDRMAECYPNNAKLRDYLNEYYIVVVRLCIELVKLTKRTTIMRLAASWSDPEMNGFKKQLEQWSTDISSEVNLQIAFDARQVSVQSSATVSILDKLRKGYEAADKLKARREALDFCCTVEDSRSNEAFFRQSLKSGKTSLYRKWSEYAEWINSNESHNLVVTGILGSGKTVLMANMVQDLLSHTHGNANSIVTYFFCRGDNLHSQKARVVMGCLARQILQHVPELPELREVFASMHTDMDLSALLNFLIRKGKLPKHLKLYLVLDGVQESVYEEKSICRRMQNLREAITVIDCVALRTEADGRNRGFWTTRLHTIVPMPLLNEDMDAFIKTELSACRDSGELRLGQPALFGQIEQALLSGSQGMFLWVALQIRSICMMHTDAEIGAALRDLPKTLSQTYRRLLSQAKTEDWKYQAKVLRFLIAAARPLNQDELGEALSVTIGETDWVPENCINDVSSVLKSCSGLLTIDEEDDTVHFIHHSVETYLTSTGSDAFQFHEEDARKTFTDTIVTFLNYDSFSMQIAKREDTKMTLPVENLSHTILALSLENSKVKEFTLRWLKKPNKRQIDLAAVMANSANRHGSDPGLRKFKFLAYSRENVAYHLLTFWTDTAYDRSSLLRLYESPSIDWNVTDGAGRTMLMLATTRNDYDLVKTLLNRPDILVNQKDEDGWTAWLYAASQGTDKIIELLKVHSDVDTDVTTNEGKNAVTCAADAGNASTLQLLLGTATDTPVEAMQTSHWDSKDNEERSPLSHAAGSGRTSIVQMYMNRPQANCHPVDKWKRTPLHHAAIGNHPDVVKLLLERPEVSVNSQDEWGMTPLMEAVERGYSEVARLLLASGKVELTVRDKKEHDTLWYAVRYERSDLITLVMSSP